MSLSIAIFSKTPGWTRAKTRIAASLGYAKAEALHRHLVRRSLILANALQDCGHQVVYAVAEDHPDVDIWWRRQGVESWYTGPGSLGERMHRIHDRVCKGAGAGMLLGTDVPGITQQTVQDAANRLATGRAVMGPADDGGMYLFVSDSPLAAACWCGPQWGTPHAGQQFLTAIRRHHSWAVNRMPALPDLDRASDWPAVAQSMPAHDQDLTTLGSLFSTSNSEMTG